MKIAIVQLARLGDILHILPVAYELHRQGHEIHWYVSGDFATILEACSYVTVHPISVGYRDVAGAVAIAKADGYDRILSTQVDGNPDRPSVETENFTLQQWARAGAEWLGRYHDLPLVIDRREPDEERKVVDRIMPGWGNGKPILVYNLHGHSSPFLGWRDFETWLKSAFGNTYRLVDIGPQSAICRKPQHLLALIEKASLLVTVDTATLHLGYASRTPTVCLSAGKTPVGQISKWYDSEPRQHWVCKVTYDEAMTEEGRRKIVAAVAENECGGEESKPIARAPIDGICDRVWHVFDWYMGDEESNARIIQAHRSRDWHAINDRDYRMRWHELKPGQRSSADLGDPHKMPYFKDVVDYGCLEAKDDDIVLFTNSDVSLLPDSVNRVRAKLLTVPCCFSRRIDVDTDVPKTIADLDGLPAHVGADLFAFRVGWWKSHRDELPDFLIGYDAFDAVIRWWMVEYGAAGMNPPVIYHRRHSPKWNRVENQENPGRLHNHYLCHKFAVHNAYFDAFTGRPGHGFRVKTDDQWDTSKSIRRRQSSVFLPFTGEVGWLIMHYMRLVHFTESDYKIVCCERGQECLFPSANEFFYDWQMPIGDIDRKGTGHPMYWPGIERRFAGSKFIQSGGLTNEQERSGIHLGRIIPLTRRAKGLRVDVCIGSRRRDMLPEKNYQHWQTIADQLRDAGFTYAIIGTRESSWPIEGAEYISGDFGWDGAIELLENCRMFIGTDTGSAHLASVVDSCPMIVQAVPRPKVPGAESWNWGWIHRMKQTSTHPVHEIAAEHWDNPEVMTGMAMELLIGKEAHANA